MSIPKAMVAVSFSLISILLPAAAQYATVTHLYIQAVTSFERGDLYSGVVTNSIYDERTNATAYTTQTTNSLVVPGELMHASSLQDSLGFSALSVGFCDDTRTFYEKVGASVCFTIGVTNEANVSLPLRLHMQIMPGRLQLRDETANGLRYASGSGANKNFLRTMVLFEVLTNGPSGLGTPWQWARYLEGGRAGASNTVYALDRLGVGTPPVTRRVSPDGMIIEDDWDSFTATLDFGQLKPQDEFFLQYSIGVLCSGSDNFLGGEGATGALVEAGDPFDLSAGLPDATGAGLVFKAGERVVGMFKPLKLRHFNRVGDQVQFSFDADPERAYQVEFRDSLTTGEWSPLTNIPPVSAWTTHHISDTSPASQRFYRLCSP